MKSFTAIAAFAAHAAFLPAIAGEMPAESKPILVATADEVVVEGEVRKVDSAAKKVTIKHGEIKNLDMPAMTMVFHVSDPAMLDKVKAGDKVKFRADKIGGAYTVVEIEAVK